MAQPPFIAIDIGNTRTKFGLFDATASQSFPLPTTTLEIATGVGANEESETWLSKHCGGERKDQVAFWIGSVHREATAKLAAWLGERIPVNRVHILQFKDFPITLAVDHPEKLGLDRIAGGLAAGRLRLLDRGEAIPSPGVTSLDRAAIVADLGSALTVDLISAEGVFRGGAILPGIGMSARALHDFTDQLPLIPMSELSEPVPPVGVDTVRAMRSGLYWGAVGAMRELIARQSEGLAVPPHVFLTGGAAPAVAKLLSGTARYEPHLVLSGIALAAQAQHL